MTKFPAMTKCLLTAVAGFLSLGHCLSAQQFDGSSLSRPYPSLPSLGLEERERFFFSTALGSMQPTMSFLSPVNSWEPQNALPNASSRRNSVDNVVELRTPDRIQYGGEVGFLYGKSSGKYGREDFQSYIIGTVGNDKFFITAGYLHQETSGRVPYWIRR